MTDEEVVDQSMKDPEMFGVLFDRHFDRIARFCTRRVGTVQGEDIAGDVFQWAFENRQRLDPKRGAVLSWLFRIANNYVRHAQRSAGRRDLAYSQWSTKLGWERTTRTAPNGDAWRASQPCQPSDPSRRRHFWPGLKPRNRSLPAGPTGAKSGAGTGVDSRRRFPGAC